MGGGDGIWMDLYSKHFSVNVAGTVGGNHVLYIDEGILAAISFQYLQGLID